MKYLLVLAALLSLNSCYKNGRDAQEPHQIIAEPKNRWVHWQQEAPVDVSEDRETSVKPCQQVN